MLPDNLPRAAVLLCGVFLVFGNQADATLYNVTPHTAENVMLTGGEIETDGTTGDNILFADLNATWTFELSEGGATSTLTNANSEIVFDCGISVTPTDITWKDEGPDCWFSIVGDGVISNDPGGNKGFIWFSDPAELSLLGPLESIVFISAPLFDGNVASVPEPTTMALASLGVLGLLGCRRRRQRLA